MTVQPPWQEAPPPGQLPTAMSEPEPPATQVVEVGPSYGDTAAHVAAQLVGRLPGGVAPDDHLAIWEGAADQVYTWLLTKHYESHQQGEE